MNAEGDVTPWIVVGVDGSKQSEQALRWAVRFAEATGAQVHAVVAREMQAIVGLAAPEDFDPQDDAMKLLAHSINEGLGPTCPVDVQIVVRQGRASTILIEESEGALMLVVGGRGHGGLTGLLPGSVCAGVAEHAHCPVLVIRGDKDPPPVRAR